jgi:hypothetical protein
MYNNTNTDVKVPVEVSSQLGNHGKQTKENMHIMTYVVQGASWKYFFTRGRVG